MKMSENETQAPAANVIKFKTKEATASKQVNYTFPASLTALTEKWGEDAIFAAATANLTINLQNVLRRNFDKPETELQTLADSWNPNERAAPVKQSPFERAQGALDKLSGDELRELANKLKALQKAAQTG
jgi:hypothetical protein